MLQQRRIVKDLRNQIDTKDPLYTDRKSTRLNSSHANISYAVFCLKKKKTHPVVSMLHLSTQPYPGCDVLDRPELPSSEYHTSDHHSHRYLVCRLILSQQNPV